MITDKKYKTYCKTAEEKNIKNLNKVHKKEEVICESQRDTGCAVYFISYLYEMMS